MYYKFIIRFEPTYEELKLEFQIITDQSLIRFEPTYEELKPSQKNVREYDVHTIWAYLWGIETQTSKNKSSIKI